MTAKERPLARAAWLVAGLRPDWRDAEAFYLRRAEALACLRAAAAPCATACAAPTRCYATPLPKWHAIGACSPPPRALRAAQPGRTRDKPPCRWPEAEASQTTP